MKLIKTYGDRPVYTDNASGGDNPRLAAIIPPQITTTGNSNPETVPLQDANVNSNPETITLEKAWEAGAVFLFFREIFPSPADNALFDRIIEDSINYLENIENCDTRFIWFNDRDSTKSAIRGQNLRVLGGKTAEVSWFDFGNMALRINEGCTISVDENSPFIKFDAVDSSNALFVTPEDGKKGKDRDIRAAP